MCRGRKRTARAASGATFQCVDYTAIRGGSVGASRLNTQLGLHGAGGKLSVPGDIVNGAVCNGHPRRAEGLGHRPSLTGPKGGGTVKLWRGPMTIAVDVRPEVEAELARQAAACGRALELDAVRLLEEAVHVPAASVKPSAPAEANDLVELFAPVRGLFAEIGRAHV